MLPFKSLIIVNITNSYKYAQYIRGFWQTTRRVERKEAWIMRKWDQSSDIQFFFPVNLVTDVNRLSPYLTAVTFFYNIIRIITKKTIIWDLILPQILRWSLLHYFVTEVRAYSPHHFLVLHTDHIIIEDNELSIYKVIGCVIAKEWYLPRSQLFVNIY